MIAMKTENDFSSDDGICHDLSTNRRQGKDQTLLRQKEKTVKKKEKIKHIIFSCADKIRALSLTWL